MEQRITRLEEEVEKLKSSSKKDYWDKLKILIEFLIPLSIAFAGFYYANAQKDAEIKSTKNMADL